MFRELRRKEKQMHIDRAYEILKTGDYGVLSTSGGNGYAYGVPLNYCLINNAILFHCAVEGFKLDNIEFNNRVSFCVISKAYAKPEKFSYGFESVVAFGRAREITGEEKQEALMALIEKYSGEYMEKGREYIARAAQKTKVIKIDIEHITGKAAV